MRNNAAHPGDAVITEPNLASAFSDLKIINFDNPKFSARAGKHLLDNEVEFDHIIPVSKGGSSEESNIRLTCFDCNRDKNDLVEI